MDEKKAISKLAGLCDDFGVSLEDAIAFLEMVMTHYDFQSMYRMLGYANVRQFLSETPDSVLIDRLESRNAAITLLEETCSPSCVVSRPTSDITTLRDQIEGDILTNGIIEASQRIDSLTALCLASSNKAELVNERFYGDRADRKARQADLSDNAKAFK